MIIFHLAENISYFSPKYLLNQTIQY